jgi:hypothetical protein
VQAELERGSSTRDAAVAVARRLGVAKREVYALAIDTIHLPSDKGHAPTAEGTTDERRHE